MEVVNIFNIFVFPVFLGIYLGVELPSHIKTLMFNFLSNCQNVSHRGCTILHFYLQYMRFPNFSISLPNPCCFLVFEGIKTTLMDVKWYLPVALSCISPMTGDVEHLFLCILDILMVLFGTMSPQLTKQWVGQWSQWSENLHVALQLVLPIHCSAFMDSTRCASCGAIIYS